MASILCVSYERTRHELAPALARKIRDYEFVRPKVEAFVEDVLAATANEG